jgi:hypothetical protein
MFVSCICTIKAVCNNYVDMERSTIMESTFCCGGGGGLLTDDLMEIRIKGAMPSHFTRKDKLTIWNAAHISRPSNITRVVESHCSIVISRFIKF